MHLTTGGTFWAIYQSSAVLGNLGVYFVFQHGERSIFVLFAAMAAAATLMMPWLRAPTTQRKQHAAAVSPWRMAARRTRYTAALFTDARIQLLLLFFLFSGWELGFWSGALPTIMHTKSVPLVLVFSGVGEIVGAAVLGRLSDRLGRSATLLFGLALFLAALALTAWLYEVRPVLGRGGLLLRVLFVRMCACTTPC